MISFLMSDEEWIAIGDMEESEFESFGKERPGHEFLGLNLKATQGRSQSCPLSRHANSLQADHRQ